MLDMQRFIERNYCITSLENKAATVFYPMVFLTAHVQLDIQQGIGMYLIETLQQRNMKLSV